mmetsp:Transcript_7629/g.21709  ORF Transcript_7629/g.21709 Transcript_7629/m.21709 type:complete len:206 (-) Transcript_7629:761-1378(-)
MGGSRGLQRSGRQGWSAGGPLTSTGAGCLALWWKLGGLLPKRRWLGSGRRLLRPRLTGSALCNARPSSPFTSGSPRAPTAGSASSASASPHCGGWWSFSRPWWSLLRAFVGRSCAHCTSVLGSLCGGWQRTQGFLRRPPVRRRPGSTPAAPQGSAASGCGWRLWLLDGLSDSGWSAKRSCGAESTSGWSCPRGQGRMRTSRRGKQ